METLKDKFRKNIVNLASIVVFRQYKRDICKNMYKIAQKVKILNVSVKQSLIQNLGHRVPNKKLDFFLGF